MSTAQPSTPLPTRHARLLSLHLVLFSLSITSIFLFAYSIVNLPWLPSLGFLWIGIGLSLFWFLDRRYRFGLLVWHLFTRFQTGILALLLLEAAVLLVFGTTLFAPYSSLDLIRRATGLQAHIDLGNVDQLAYAPDSRSLLATDVDGAVTLLATAPPAVRWHITVGKSAERVVFSPDSTLVALLLTNGNLTLVRASDGAVLRTIPQAEGSALVVSPDSTLVATAGWEEPGRVWRISDGKQLQRIEHPRGRVFLSFAADNTLALRMLQPDPDVPLMITFSPDGRLAAQRYGGSTVDLRDTMSGQTLRTLYPSSDRVGTTAFSADGTLVATAGSFSERVVQVWRVADGQQVASYIGHAGASGLVFAPDGRTLVAEEFGELVFWRLP